MPKIVKSILYSRIVWIAGVLGVLWATIGVWWDALPGGLTPTETTQVILATALAVTFVGTYIVLRGWRKRPSHEDNGNEE